MKDMTNPQDNSGVAKECGYDKNLSMKEAKVSRGDFKSIGKIMSIMGILVSKVWFIIMETW